MGVELWASGGARGGLMLGGGLWRLEPFDPIAQQRRQLIAIDPWERGLSVMRDTLDIVDAVVNQIQGSERVMSQCFRIVKQFERRFKLGDGGQICGHVVLGRGCRGSAYF